jgi:hypothetical protein
MAKASNEAKKITFGVRRKGKHSKTSGPKSKKTKRSRGQG